MCWNISGTISTWRAKPAMWMAVLLGLLAIALLGSAWLLLCQQRRIRSLDEAREKVEQEETRVFDFLHRLGESLSETTRPADLHARIVEGAQRVLKAQAGALYLETEGGSSLRAAFLSRDCPPLVEIPEQARQEGGASFSASHFLRMRALKSGEGVLGAVWRDREPILLSGRDSRLEVAQREVPATTSAMAAPLLHGGRDARSAARAAGGRR